MRRGDWAWPAGILVLGAVELGAMSSSVGTLQHRVISSEAALAGILVEASACAALVARRRWPVAVALVVTALIAAMPLAGVHLDEPMIPMVILALAMAAAGRYRNDWWGLAAPLVGTVATFVARALDQPGEVDTSDWLFILVLLTTPYLFGRLLARQAEAHERERALVQREAAREERARIARELHDVLAHSMSSMVMRANVAADVSSDPVATTALRGIAETGSECLEEVGQLVRLIRNDDPLGTPTPGTADIPALVWSFRASGLELLADDLELPRHPLSPALDVSVFRVVQEALTNAAKHSSGPTRLSIREMSPNLAIEVVNPMSSTRGDHAPGTGQGLIGMRERVELFGGSLRAGPVGDGTFEVAALLPMRVPG